MAPEKQLVWTRGLDHWTEDEPLIRQTGQLYRHLPCVHLSPLSHPAQADSSLAGAARPLTFVLTSAYTLACLRQQPSLLLALHAPDSELLAVGQATLAAIRTVGLHGSIPPGVETAAGLGQAIIREGRRERHYVLPGPLERAFDLPVFLSQHGFSCQRIDLYRNEAGLRDPTTARLLALVEKRVLLADLAGVVCFASPSAVEGFCQGLELASLARFHAAAIGSTTAEAARRHFIQVEVASEAGMAELLAAACRFLT